MTDHSTLRQDLVTANHILARPDVADSFGHVSVRNPDAPDTFLSRARAPACIEEADITEFAHDGLPRRDLRVSPVHAMFLDGVLVPATCLVKGHTIMRDLTSSSRWAPRPRPSCQ